MDFVGQVTFAWVVTRVVSEAASTAFDLDSRTAARKVTMNTATATPSTVSVERTRFRQALRTM